MLGSCLFSTMEAGRNKDQAHILLWIHGGQISWPTSLVFPSFVKQILGSVEFFIINLSSTPNSKSIGALVGLSLFESVAKHSAIME